ncbi:MAG: hypothetical protein AAF958_09215 [Planctomycetota bacterium]
MPAIGSPDRANTGTEAAKADDSAERRISNPQAREIRFDGQELVLGGGDCQSIRVATLRETAQDLKSRGRHRSAAETVRLHRRTASRWVMESIETSDRDEMVPWVARILDRGASVPLHTKFCQAASDAPQAAMQFSTARGESITSLAGGSPAVETIQKLQAAAEQLGTPLASLEAERLTAMSEVVAGQPHAAARRLAGAARLAAQQGAPDPCAQLWLLAAETHLRSEAIEASATAWQNAVRAQLTAMTAQGDGNTSLPPLDTVFWEQAERLRPPATEFPPEIALAMNSWKLRIGIGSDLSVSPKASLWTAVAANQLTLGQAHLATLSIKRAEVEASDAAKPWLQIALARSVAAQGQTPVATTILGSLTSHSDPVIRAASLATLGSIKIQAGAYEQGSRFLVQALATEGANQWQGRLPAEADLANVRLIVGDLQKARESLHSVQQKLALDGRWQSLVQSLENELAMVELEQDPTAVKQLRRRIEEIEQETI